MTIWHSLCLIGSHSLNLLAKFDTNNIPRNTLIILIIFTWFHMVLCRLFYKTLHVTAIEMNCASFFIAAPIDTIGIFHHVQKHKF